MSTCSICILVISHATYRVECRPICFWRCLRPSLQRCVGGREPSLLVSTKSKTRNIQSELLKLEGHRWSLSFHRDMRKRLHSNSHKCVVILEILVWTLLHTVQTAQAVAMQHFTVWRHGILVEMRHYKRYGRDRLFLYSRYVVSDFLTFNRWLTTHWLTVYSFENLKSWSRCMLLVCSMKSFCKTACGGGDSARIGPGSGERGGVSLSGIGFRLLLNGLCDGIKG